MSKWTVGLHQSHRNGAKNPKQRWVVDPPGFDYRRRAEDTGAWLRAGGQIFSWGFDTTKRQAWLYAMGYADLMARTVEVVLPRGELFEIPSRYLDKEKAPLTVQRREWLPGFGENVAIKYTAHDSPNVLFLADDEVKPLALALLALHFRNNPSDSGDTDDE